MRGVVATRGRAGVCEGFCLQIDPSCLTHSCNSPSPPGPRRSLSESGLLIFLDIGVNKYQGRNK